MMTLSESLGQKCHPVSHAAPLKRNTPTPFSFLSLSPRQTGVMEKKRMGGPQCVPPILFAPARHEPVFTILVESKCCVGFFVSLGQSGSRLCHVGRVKMLYVFFFLLRLQQARSRLCHVGCVKVLCLFFLPLGQARSHLCHVGSSHPVCSTHLTEKTWIPPESTNQSLSCRLRQSDVSGFFLPLGKQDRVCAMSAQRVPPILLAPRISRTNVDPSSKHGHVCAMSVASKCCVFFFVTLEQG